MKVATPKFKIQIVDEFPEVTHEDTPLAVGIIADSYSLIREKKSIRLYVNEELVIQNCNFCAIYVDSAKVYSSKRDYWKDEESK